MQYLKLLGSPFYFGDYELMTRILVGMVLGLASGLAVNSIATPEIAAAIGHTFAIPGDIFLGLLKMIVAPLVFVAVFLGIAANDNLDDVKKMGGLILLYFFMSTLISTSWGAALTVLLEPGNGLGEAFKAQAMADAQAAGMQVATVVDNPLPWYKELRQGIGGIVPGNPVKSLAFDDMLHIVIIAGIFGALALIKTQNTNCTHGQNSAKIISIMETAQEWILDFVKVVMKIAPIGVFGLMTYVTASSGISAITSLLGYMGVLLLALASYTIIVYGAVVMFLGKRSPISFFKHIRELQLLAFSMSSSSAVMPKSIETAESNDISPKVSKFVIPLGTTINMDGTAMYQAVAAIFLMQAFGMDITFLSVISILGVAILASVGTPGAPGVGLVILGGILIDAGLPGEAVGIIFGVDRLMDMFRTVVNVSGDQTAAVVMNRLLGGKEEATPPQTTTV